MSLGFDMTAIDALTVYGIRIIAMPRGQRSVANILVKPVSGSTDNNARAETTPYRRKQIVYRSMHKREAEG